VGHQNPGGDKERGHFGSTGQRKCYGLISIEKQDDLFTLKPKMLRRAGNAEMKIIQFSYDQSKGYHIQVDAPDNETAKRLKARNKVIETIKKVFPASSSLRHTDAVKLIMEATGVVEKTARNWIKDMAVLGYVIQREDKNYKINIERVNGVKEG